MRLNLLLTFEIKLERRAKIVKKSKANTSKAYSLNMGLKNRHPEQPPLGLVQFI